MEERTFKGILLRFGAAILWCFVLGVVLGILYKLPFNNLQQLIKVIILENSATKSFNIVSVFSIISLGSIIAISGRSSGMISTFRYTFGYKPVELSLTLAAVFYGLLFGFSLATLEWPLLAIGFYAFLFTVGVVLLLLWLSFKGNGVRSENSARFHSSILVLIAIGVVWYAYLR